MIDRFRDIARALVAVLLLGMAGAAAQTATLGAGNTNTTVNAWGFQ
jgi:hypothetical protein